MYNFIALVVYKLKAFLMSDKKKQFPPIIIYLNIKYVDLHNYLYLNRESRDVRYTRFRRYCHELTYHPRILGNR